MAEAVDRLGAGRTVAGIAAPESVQTSLHELKTFDGAQVCGVLHRLPGSSTVMVLMHPRQSLAHHPMIGWFLTMGASVWTQDTRSPNNDLNLVHEQAILDLAAGQVFLRDLGFESVITFGHSGGGALSAFYIEQAALRPELRIDVTPAGRPIALAGAVMPVPDAALFLAPHPGQGRVLLSCIDPSVASDDDPLSVVPELDMFDPRNGFATPPAASSYAPDFLTRYRQAQLRRMKHIDAVARERAGEAAQARARYARTEDPRDRRAALAPRLITTYRTDADPRYVDLSLSPNDRPYGSLFGRRPDLTNYGLVGFGRLTTPDAWLSTWSGLSSNAVFERCAAGIHVPTLYLEFSGDQAAYPDDADRMFGAIPAADKSRSVVRGMHFGQPLRPDEPTGYEVAADVLGPWLAERFELVAVRETI
ncbi:alpha/beta hydrolase [Amycolatopsis pithecellobii]|uniref:Alpha/beta hydrolase n=1 Tax=Amycolatopsis pithecellobii TaxID=664692 RepID=A0A6N7YJJ4_9PSEU|nr:alpha/beta hydrolase [Amycolatopsis pithecellobii]MTD53067.1 alpha/beta hydrolase [Amycolatopsis pithecellobii]